MTERDDVPTSNPPPWVPLGGIEGLKANIALARQIAEHFELGFHIANGDVLTYAGWKSEERSATEEELALWRLIERQYDAEQRTSTT